MDYKLLIILFLIGTIPLFTGVMATDFTIQKDTAADDLLNYTVYTNSYGVDQFWVDNNGFVYANGTLVTGGTVLSIHNIGNVTSVGCAEDEVLKVNSTGFFVCGVGTGSDNLGDHLATQNLNMSGFSITDIGGYDDPSAGNLRLPFEAQITFTNSTGDGYGIMTFETTNRGGQFTTSHDISIGGAGCRPDEYCQNADLWLDTDGLKTANTATGIITMRTRDSSGTALEAYTQIEMFNSDTTDGAHSGSMLFSTYHLGSKQGLLELKGTNNMVLIRKMFSLSSSDSFTISGGVITIDTSFINVDTQSAAASDDLDTITPPTGCGGCVVTVVAANSARTVVMKDSTGNLQLAGDFSLDNVQDTILLIYDSTTSTWKEISRSDNGA